MEQQNIPAAPLHQSNLRFDNTIFPQFLCVFEPLTAILRTMHLLPISLCKICAASISRPANPLYHFSKQPFIHFPLLPLLFSHPFL